MRKIPLIAVAIMLAGATVVALASASQGSQKAAPPSWLPTGVTAAGGNWLSGEGDVSNSRYSTLTQINTSNVQNLKVVWNQQFNPTDIQFSPEGQPTCCPNDLLYQTYIQGVAAMKPDTGELAWNYKGPVSAAAHAGRTATAERQCSDPVVQFQAQHASTAVSRTARSSR